MRNWDDFDKFLEVEGFFLPERGEGTTMATQAVTATSKLIYKWFNDGDVYDNVHSGMTGWCNDLSSYANWLAVYITGAKEILEKIFTCHYDDEYTEILYELAELIYNSETLAKYNNFESIGTIYKCDGRFEFNEETEEDDWEDDEEDW